MSKVQSDMDNFMWNKSTVEIDLNTPMLSYSKYVDVQQQKDFELTGHNIYRGKESYQKAYGNYCSKYRKKTTDTEKEFYDNLAKDIYEVFINSPPIEATGEFLDEIAELIIVENPRMILTQNKQSLSPDTDGLTHINIYSKGKTELGRLLTNFAHTPFVYSPYGEFASVEAFWYYAKTGFQHKQLMCLHGFRAKEEGKKHKSVPCENFNELVLESIRCKLRQNRHILFMLTESILPLEHYYAYGTTGSWKPVHQPQHQWIVDEIERIRYVCKQHKGIK